MKRTTLLVASIALGALPLCAQNVESLALPDVLDSRTTAARLTARIGELNREAALQQSLNNLVRAAQIRSVVATLQSTGPSRIVFANALGVQSGTLLSLSSVSNYDIAPGPSVFVLRSRAPSTQTLGLSTWGTPADNFQMYVLGSNIVVLGPGKRLFGSVLRHLFVIDPTTADILFAGFLAG